MIARVIAWSARNLVLVFVGTLFAVAGRPLRLEDAAARRDPRPLRRPGDRLHRVSRPGAAGRRGPGHLSADDGDADGAEIQGRARLLVLRRVLRLRRVRGRHRSLLRQEPRPRVPERRGASPSRRRDPDPRAGRDGRRLGLPVRRGRQGQDARRASVLAGLGRAVRRLRRRRGRRGRKRRRVREAVLGRRRSQPHARPGRDPGHDPKDAIGASNMDVGGRTIELSEFEYMVRGRGYLEASRTSRTSSS